MTRDEKIALAVDQATAAWDTMVRVLTELDDDERMIAWNVMRHAGWDARLLNLLWDDLGSQSIEP